MFVKSITLDGFKSYANRTQVTQFDPMFNAITGLNGSGKSNILDAICFVLGITNLSQVRAKNLIDLVYKNGQAGITKATVSIVFDNSDKESSPVGYRDQDEITVTRQVAIGGKSKYLINGHNAQKGRVENFFHSVQLNVNNPHFLIMQGRITKVLNMKPRETLSMVEEAAGTRMYETKKAASLNTMERKEQKMAEIERMLAEEIQPTLNKLRKERTAFMDWQKNKMEIDHLNRLILAHQYMQYEQMLDKSKQESAGIEAEVAERNAVIEECTAEMEHAEKMVADVEGQMEEALNGGLKEIEAEANELSKGVVKATEKWKSKKAELTVEVEARAAAIASREQALAAIPVQEAAIADAEAAQDDAVKAHDAAIAEQEKEEARRHAVSLGMAADEDGNTKTFAEQIQDVKSSLTGLDTEKEQAKMKISHLKPTLKEKKAAAKGATAEHAKMTKTLESTSGDLAKIQAKLDKIDFSDEKEADLMKQRNTAQTAYSKATDRVDGLEAKLSQLEFKYADPVKGFDRRKVHGLVAELITVKDPKAMTALEVSAGGKLYNVVVDSAETGKLLLSKGKLKRRVTIIPIDKVKARSVRPEAVKAARKEVGDDAQVALSYVGYDDAVDAAMKYVFGANFICPDMGTAKQVTFHDRIRTKSVTLDGDVMDPSGTLTGGSRPNTAPVLAQLHELKKARDECAALEQELRAIEGDLDAMQKSAKAYRELKTQWDIKTHEHDLAKGRIEQSSCHQVVQEVADLEATLKESEEFLAGVKDQEKALKEKMADIQAEMKRAVSDKEKRLKAVEKCIAAAKKGVQAARANMNKATQAVEAKKLELHALKTEVAGFEGQLAALDASVAEIESQEQELVIRVQEVTEVYQAKHSAAQEQRETITKLEGEIQDLRASAAAAKKKSNAAALELKKISNRAATLEKRKKEAASAVASLLKKHSWIAKEKQCFGQPGTTFEFKKGDPTQDPHTFQSRLDALTESQEKLSKNVNMKVMSMFDQTEKSAVDLMKKKQIVEADRAKIAQAITELDEKKNETLQKAHEQVNRDFGSIFSMLLPGTQAELALTESGDLLDGLRVRVAFGSVWKEGLTELSGGQRSLVALSLILALLLFKPAPIYILDEIDAALDLSHTQNIGQMLKAHFKQSQFIVVSLKEGMFNNANVLFKTAFIDGVSTVKRFAQSRAAIEADDSSKENAKPRGKGRAARGAAAAPARTISQRNK
mmetsp:Transcript_20953/g.54505  ORF Transcript_20953/g.54505 Transcript_20953/m.54505 type:complete len:1217 (+) Transcript_20953:172-3822(+)